MLYPIKFQIRQSTVMVIVVLMMGTVLYEVTRSESFAGSSAAARTQDISLPALKDTSSAVRLAQRQVDYIGTAAGAAAPIRAETGGDELIVLGSAAASPSVAGREQSTARASTSFAGGRSTVIARGGSSSSRSYASGGYGMSGVGAWGGASGQVRAAASVAAMKTETAKAPKEKAARVAPARTEPARTERSRNSGSSGGGTGVPSSAASPEAAGAVGPPATPPAFTTGAAGVDSRPGAVVSLEAGKKSPASSPAPTPEPMSLLMVGAGLAAAYKARRFLE